MPQTIRVLVVEHEPLFRRGLASSLESVQDFTVIADTGNREEAFGCLDEGRPDVAIVGTSTEDTSCIQLASDLRHHSPAVAMVIISVDENDEELFAAIRAGASAYCGRNIEEETLHDIVRRSAGGEYVINEQLLSKPYVASRVLDQFRNSSQHDARLEGTFMPLTERELEILKRVSTGLTNAEIGYALGISAQTVKNHVTSILRKLAVNDRTQAVVTALRNGWLSIDDAGVPDGEKSGNGRRASAEARKQAGSALPGSHRDH